MQKLRVAVIGCGGIANGKHLPSLAAVKEVEMVAFCDVIPERAEKAAEKYGVEGAKVYTDYRALLEAEKPDVVHVCTPNRSHCEITVAALEAGCHVMCEKPMAKTAADARKMLETAKRTGKKLTIGYQNRFKSDAAYLKAACEAGELGDIYFAKALAVRRRGVPTWGVFLNEEEQGGGPLIDIGTHALDLTLFMMDNYKPLYVVGNTYRKLADTKNAANAWGPWDPEKFTVEDSAFGFITMENGATIVLESSWALNVADPREAQCILAGTKGGADFVGGLRFNREHLGRLTTEVPDLKAGGAAFYEGVGDDRPERIEARQWINAILNDTEPLVKPEQALVVTEILEAIYTSAKTNQPVRFDNK